MNHIHLNSVNFEHGMLLTPDHFLRQERYFDSNILWVLRYATREWGLVGAGLRAEDGGAVAYDPVVTVTDEQDFIQITVSGCRAIAPSGCMIDLPPEVTVSQRFAKADLEGTTSCGVYLLAIPHEKQTVEGPADEFNPQIPTERRPQYRLSLRPPGQFALDSLAIARIRKSSYGAGYERDRDYIPPCVSMLGHSELAAAWRRITEETARLYERLIELYRAMPAFLTLFRERGIETEVDAASLSLVAQILSAVHACLYDLLDPLQPPRRFFGHLRQLFHFTALQIDLNPQVQGYFETLRESGETEFVALLENQHRLARSSVQIQIAEDLALEVRSALRSLADLRSMEMALEGKYLDFRINRSLESMNFLFDRGGNVLYRLAAKPSRTQATASDCVITFAQLRLEGREKYRMVLVGERNATFETGSKIAIEIRVNEGSGFRRSPTILSAEPRVPEQCNFEFDFDAPDVPTITDLRVSFPAHYAIRTGLLFVRQRFYASSPRERPLSELPPASDGERRRLDEVQRDPAVPPARRMEPIPPSPARWENQRRPDSEPAGANPPRQRRRLE
jgi:hypothetical protein